MDNTEEKLLARCIEQEAAKEPRSAIFQLGAILLDDRHRARICDALRAVGQSATEQK